MAIEPFNIIPKLEVHPIYKGTTNGSGDFTVNYPVAYASIPTIVPVQTPTTAPNRTVRVVSSTTTGFTVKVEQRSSVNLLGVDVLLSATTPVSGANISVIVLE